jgi:c-di-GMP-binding flagellar brake protein YcgR
MTKSKPLPSSDFPESRDQRSHKRIGFEAILMVFRPLTHKEKRAQHYMPADVLDLSLGGMKFSAHREMANGDMIKLRLSPFEILKMDEDVDPEEVADEFEFVATAEIVTANLDSEGNSTYGVKFEEIIQGNVEAIEAFIEKHAS